MDDNENNQTKVPAPANLHDAIHGTPWMILPAVFAQIQSIYTAHLRGHKIDLAEVEAKLGRPLVNVQPEYSMVDGGVAVLPVMGTIAPRMNMFMAISGGVSTSMLINQVKVLGNDDAVKSVLLDMNTPGGSGYMLPELGDVLKELAEKKPVVAFTSQIIASAGYWIASAANHIVGSDAATSVGSIGVAISHEDVSKRNEQEGVAYTEIVAGQYKRATSENAPLSDAGKKILQDTADYYMGLFVGVVRPNRGMSEEQVQAVADGRMYHGTQATSNGLMDSIMPMSELLEKMASDPKQFKRRVLVAATAAAPAAAPSAATNVNKGKTMNPEELKTAHPDTHAALLAAGAAAERQRIADVRAQSLPGHESLIEQLVADGKTTGPEAASKVLAAHKATLSTMATNLSKDAPASVAASTAAANVGEVALTQDEMVARADALAEKNKITFQDAWKQLGFDAKLDY